MVVASSYRVSVLIALLLLVCITQYYFNNSIVDIQHVYDCVERIYFYLQLFNSDSWKKKFPRISNKLAIKSTTCPNNYIYCLLYICSQLFSGDQPIKLTLLAYKNIYVYNFLREKPKKSN